MFPLIVALSCSVIYDIIIEGSTIIDGTGGPRYESDVVIKDGIIIGIVNASGFEAIRRINGKGYLLTPGFIDVHAHLDIAPFFDPRFLPQVHQGITSVAVGMCGLSPAPSDQKTDVQLYKYFKLGDIPQYKEKPFVNFGTYINAIEKIPIPINMIPLVGHGAIRNMVLGNKDQVATEENIKAMKVHAEEAMEAGAFGMTTGLIYPPGLFSNLHELVEISKVIAKHGGIYMSHMRSESDDILESVQEVIEIGKQAKIPAQVSHFKVCGAKNLGKGVSAVKLIENARNEGIDVMADQYPYSMSATGFSSILPPWALVGTTAEIVNRLKNEESRNKIKKDILNGLDGFDNVWLNVGNPQGIVILSAPGHAEYAGKSVKELAGNKDPLDWSLDYLINSNMEYTKALFYEIQEPDLRTIMQKDFVMVGSDTQFVNMSSSDKVHPRSMASHARYLRQFVREERFVSLEEGIRKMTGLPAQRFKLSNLGTIKHGNFADIVMFKLDNVVDTAGDSGSLDLCSGFDYVIVHGKLVVDNKQITSAKPGRILKRNHYPVPIPIDPASTPIPTAATPNSEKIVYKVGIAYKATIGVLVFVVVVLIVMVVKIHNKKVMQSALTDNIL